MASSKTPAEQFTVLYFAAASDITKKLLETFNAPLPAIKLFEVLDEKYPGIKEKVLSSSAVTINLEYIDLDESMNSEDTLVIKAGDEVAIIPPVSSG